jgi:sulfhydrogenase subunit delta
MSAPEKTKPKVAFFDFTGCEGCQLTVVDALQTHLELLEMVDIVEFREAMSEKADYYDIAFVEGSIARSEDVLRLRDIRERAGLVVALGACAHLGGVNAIRNGIPLETVQEIVYGDKAEWFPVVNAHPISDLIQVDAVVPGCPIDREEFINIVEALLQGRQPKPPEYPLCIECKLHENVCIFDRGGVCLGPIVSAGCGAICPAYGIGCEGCRGLIPEPQMEPFRQVLAEHGLSDEEIDIKLSMFMNNQTVFEREKAHA